MNPAPGQDLDSFLNEGVEADLKAATQGDRPAAAQSPFPGPPNGVGVPPQKPPAAPRERSLAGLGITRGGVVRNPSTVARTQLDNPLTNPRPVAGQPAGGVPVKAKSAPASILDRSEDPDLAKLGTSALLTSMDANLEQRARELAEAAVGSRKAPTAPPEPNVVAFRPQITPETTLAELLRIARAQPEGLLRIGTARFSVEVRITA